MQMSWCVCESSVECEYVRAHTIPLLHDDHVSCNHADRNERRSLCECKCVNRIEKRL